MAMLNVIFTVLALQTVIVAATPNCSKASQLRWTWECRNGLCVKVSADGVTSIRSIDTCRSICGDFGGLWPQPTYPFTLGQDLVNFDVTDVRLVNISAPTKDVESLVLEAASIFTNDLTSLYPNSNTEFKLCQFAGVTSDVQITVQITNDDLWPQLETVEGYKLTVTSKENTTQITILAETFFGARHAFESLSQLVTYDPNTNTLLIVSNTNIQDTPVFPHRAIMLDTARNYYSVASIKRLLDAMSYNKLNVFHWHFTDSQSFPFQSIRVPQLSEWGAYSPDKVYTPENVVDVVNYARVRGIRVIPEPDSPSHAGNGWQWGEEAGLGRLALCVNEQPWAEFCYEPPCGQLNPVNNNTFNVLGEFYRDVKDLFKSNIVHIGADEVHFNCWRTAPEVKAWFQENGLAGTDEDVMNLFGDFLKRALVKLREAGGNPNDPVIVWSSEITDPKVINNYLDSNTHIVQWWGTKNDSAARGIISLKYRLIISNYDALYMDCGTGHFVDHADSWCGSYHSWKTIYENDPFAVVGGADGINETLLLGAEAPLWSEGADERSFEPRLWPRGAALAERLWSSPTGGWKIANERMHQQRERMVQRGINADAIQPEYCHQNEGACLPETP